MAKKKVLTLNHEVLPAELVEEILVYLPVKSVLQFSSVSKTWNSIISESRFVKRFRGCAGRDKNIVLSSGYVNMLTNYRIENFAPSYNVSSISSMASSSAPAPGVEASSTGLVVSKFGDNMKLLAWCDELWLTCLSNHKSFFLWNPSTGRHKKLPKPSIILKNRVYRLGQFNIGLGYDSVGDDYKILKIPGTMNNCNRGELYSLRSDSWRDVPNVTRCRDISFDSNCAFFSGNLHWLPHKLAYPRGIISFDLSTEKFGEVIGPPLDNISRPVEGLGSCTKTTFFMYISVLRGMLCVSITDILVDEKCDIWVMEEYGVATSWTLKFTIKNMGPILKIQPLCILENGAILVRGYCKLEGNFKVYVHQDGKSRLQQLSYGSSSRHCCRITDSSLGGSFNIEIGIVYADSLVAPDAFV